MSSFAAPQRGALYLSFVSSFLSSEVLSLTNIFDYIAWRGDLSFAQDPPNQVDMLIFSALAYLRFGDDVKSAEPPLREAAEMFFALPDHPQRARTKNDLELLRAAAASHRFGNVGLFALQDQFVPEENTQFAALTFLLPDGSMVLSFRGTDDTLVGWKEDLSMCFQQVIPSQGLALQYTHDVWETRTAPMRLCGHSKGGNLAVFAGARSSPMIQQWILGVFNNDGPGFSDYMVGDPGYLAMVPRIRTFVPQSSIIGMIMEHEEPFTIIHSSQVGGIMQHDFFTWEVIGKEFLPVEEITVDSRFINRTIHNWLGSMNREERSRMVEALFGLLTAGDVSHLSEVLQPKNVRNYMKTLGSDQETRKILGAEFQALIEAARKARQDMTGDAKALDSGDIGSV